VAVATSFGCGALVALDHYRQCNGNDECAAASGDASDAQLADTGVDSPTSVDAGCSQSSQCPAKTPLCDRNKCVGISGLVRGTSGHICVLTDQQALWCWGQNASGQVGINSPASTVVQPARVPIPNDQPVAQAMTSSSATCALTGGVYPQVFCWGDAPGTTQTKKPNGFVNLTQTPDQIALVGSTACAHLLSGAVSCWGDNGDGQLGCGVGDGGVMPIGSNPNAPTALPGTLDEIALALHSSCGRKAGSGDVSCWGSNTGGVLAQPLDGGANCLSVTSTISTQNKLTKLWGTDEYFCAKDYNGAHFCWGASESCSILGTMCSAFEAIPQPKALQFTDVPTSKFYGPTDFAILAPGWRHACAAMKDGTVWCWGQNDHGQVGNPNEKGTPLPDPVQVTGLKGQVIDLASYRHMSCALLTTGNVVCWGQNGEAMKVDGRLGVGSLEMDVRTPTPVAWP